MINALKLIASKMQRSANPWLIEGDTALVLQGVPIASKSVRIVTDRVGAYELGEYLRTFGPGIQTKREGSAISYVGSYKMFNVSVEVVGDWVITFKNYIIPIPAAEIFALNAKAEVGDYVVPVVPLEWQFFIDLVLERDQKQLRLILEEEPDHARIVSLVERFGLFAELKEVLSGFF